MLLGQKILPSDRVAGMRDLPAGIDQRSACRHPDWTGPDDLEIKIIELREITDWQVPIYVKIGPHARTTTPAFAVKAGADVGFWTACREARPRLRTYSLSTSASRPSQRFHPLSRPCRSSESTGQASS